MRAMERNTVLSRKARIARIRSFVCAEEPDEVRESLMDLGWLDIEDVGPYCVTVWTEGQDTPPAEGGGS